MPRQANTSRIAVPYSTIRCKQVEIGGQSSGITQPQHTHTDTDTHTHVFLLVQSTTCRETGTSEAVLNRHSLWLHTQVFSPCDNNTCRATCTVANATYLEQYGTGQALPQRMAKSPNKEVGKSTLTSHVLVPIPQHPTQPELGHAKPAVNLIANALHCRVVTVHY